MNERRDDGSPLFSLLFFRLSPPVVHEEPRESNVVPPPAKQCKLRRKRACGERERELQCHRYTHATRHTSERRERETAKGRRRKSVGLLSNTSDTVPSFPSPATLPLILSSRSYTFPLPLLAHTLHTHSRGQSRRLFTEGASRSDSIVLAAKRSLVRTYRRGVNAFRQPGRGS